MLLHLPSPSDFAGGSPIGAVIHSPSLLDAHMQEFLDKHATAMAAEGLSPTKACGNDGMGGAKLVARLSPLKDADSNQVGLLGWLQVETCLMASTACLSPLSGTDVLLRRQWCGHVHIAQDRHPTHLTPRNDAAFWQLEMSKAVPCMRYREWIIGGSTYLHNRATSDARLLLCRSMLQ